MPLHAPLKLGPFTIDSEGRLAHDSESAPPSFAFRWRGRVLRSAILPDGRLTIRAVLGRIPSSASDQACARASSFALMRALARSAPRHWRVALMADHRAVLQAEIDLPSRLTATALLTAITSFALTLAPYLDLFDEAGMPA
jgi:hypothetical protein